MSIRVGMVSLGCPKNQVDAEHMLYNLREEGFEIIADAALADVVVVNTCGFIDSAKQEAIETILEFCTLKEEGRLKAVIVTGCLAERYRDEIKAEMLSRNTEEMEAGQYIVRWTSVLTQRFDTTAFKKVMPDVYKEYTKQVSSRRFSIA